MGLWIALALAVVIFLVLLLMQPSQSDEGEQFTGQVPTIGGTQVLQSDRNGTGNGKRFELSIPVENGLEIQTVGAYTGIYMEDGTDEIVTDVLMLVLENNSGSTVEYAKITMNIGEKNAEFTVTTLKPDAKVVLLEKNRMAYDNTLDYSKATFKCENLAVFQKPLSLQEDKLSFQILNGAINITNISGEDISGRIAIYYKNKAAGIYYGGITYRVLIEEGLKAGEIRQILASHFAETGSEIVFVTIDQ